MREMYMVATVSVGMHERDVYGGNGKRPDVREVCCLFTYTRGVKRAGMGSKKHHQVRAHFCPKKRNVLPHAQGHNRLVAKGGLLLGRDEHRTAPCTGAQFLGPR